MICVQVQVKYSICIVDCVQLAQWDKIVFLLTHEIVKLICGRINYIVSVLSAVLVKLTWDTVVFVKHGFGRRTEVYVLLSVEETDLSFALVEQIL